MGGKQSINRDLAILKLIRDRQNELLQELQFYGISHASDLIVSERVRITVRRGLVQMVGDIFELTNGMRETTKAKIGFNTIVIREFRNRATHNYGVLSNEIAFACMQHCTDVALRKSVIDEINSLQSELT